ncbi:hypothetical protein BCR39DRAFT_527184 [Naematelia encephala]|uniref:PH domain-containing protein n=1 Tax=Naematelia encephala TaxID=71784 RepID=A0A1Y2B8V3_9TREE|nr:hypothetical protein BCR39DRAFT_527184 [Naematelia encephala]
MSAIATKAAQKLLKGKASAWAPSDPHYVEEVDPRSGKIKRKERPIPPGLSKRDQKALRKIRRRAHRLDKGMNLCGFRVGYTFFIGIVPGLGDVVDATLNYTLIVKPARKLDIPDELLTKMLFNNAISAGLGLVPVVGDVGLAAWKANSRNAHLLEAYLTIRGQEHLATLGQGPSAITDSTTQGAHPEEVRGVFVPGSGMDGDATHDDEGKGSGGGRWGKNKSKGKNDAVVGNGTGQGGQYGAVAPGSGTGAGKTVGR